MARETREIVVQAKNDPCRKSTFKKFNIEEFPVIVVEVALTQLGITFICLVILVPQQLISR